MADNKEIKKYDDRGNHVYYKKTTAPSEVVSYVEKYIQSQGDM